MMLYVLDRIIQRYADRVVLDIDHLAIEAGGIHALLGPNGAGKTTLLNLLAFLEAPAGGTMLFQGQPVTYTAKNVLPLRRRVVLVDQHPIMFSTTVSSNIEFGLNIRKVEKTARQRIVDEVLATVGLSRYRDARAHELSGGETQRLALARALALAPEVLLCDEPTASVDAENQAIIVDLLQRINADRGTTIVFTTHDRLQATALAGYTLVLEGGRLATTTYENSYACTLLPQADGGVRCRLREGVEIAVPTPPPLPTMATTGRVTIGPQGISLCRIDPLPCPETADRVIGTIVLLMAEGEYIRVVVNVGVLMVVLMDRAGYAALRPAIGETMLLRFAAESLVFFPDSSSP